MTLIQSQANKPTSVALLLHEDVAGFAGDPRPVHEDIVGIISILENAGIPCCFVNEYALIYYGAGRKQNVGDILTQLNLRLTRSVSF